MTVRRWLVVLVAVAFALRLGFFLADPNPGQMAGLASEHGEMAHNIVSHGEWFVLNHSPDQPPPPSGAGERLIDKSDAPHPAADANPQFDPDAIEMPGLAVVLAAAWTLTGDQDYGYLQLLQIVIDSLMVLLVFWIAMRLFGRPRAALIAAGLYAVHLPIAAMTKIPHLDSWATFLTLGVFAVFLKALDAWRSGHHRWRWVIALGVLSGFGVYFRPGVYVLLVALGVAAIPLAGFRRAVVLGGVPLLIAILMTVPWTIRNAVEFDAFIPTRLAGGQSLWEGLGEIENDFGAILDDGLTEQQVRRERPDLRFGTPEYDNYLGDKAIEAIQEHPGHYARIVVRRIGMSTLLLHNSNWAAETETPFVYRDRTGNSLVSYPLERPGQAVIMGVIVTFEPLLFLIAVITAIVLWRRYWRIFLLLASIPIATLAPYVVLHMEHRYALPAAFVYLIVVGLAADLVLSRRFGWSQPTDTPLQPLTSTSGRTPTATRSRRSSPSADRTPTTSPSSRLEP
jgi:4-amino-4-deoxy-L-arabinose transferase-like glycosyltransferase